MALRGLVAVCGLLPHAVWGFHFPVNRFEAAAAVQSSRRVGGEGRSGSTPCGCGSPASVLSRDAPGHGRRVRLRSTYEDFLRSEGIEEAFNINPPGIEKKMYRDVDVKVVCELTMGGNQDYLYLDVRSGEELEELVKPRKAVHVPGFYTEDEESPFEDCEWLEMRTEFLEKVEEMRLSKSLGKDVPVLVGCKAGLRSCYAAQWLGEAGYTDVMNVESNNWLEVADGNKKEM